MPDYSFSPQFDPDSKTFQHSNGYRDDKSVGELLSMAWQFMTRETDPIEKTGFPVMSAEDNAPRGTDKTAITWIGHATLLFERDGKTILTDPMFSDRASPLAFSGPKRVAPPARSLEALPPIDVVLISHAHYDHLDMPSLRRLAELQPDIKVLAPLGVGRYASDAGFANVTELDWWQDATVDDVTVTATPARH